MKRSTRFTTAVPAREILGRIQEIIDQDPYPFPYPFRNIPQRTTLEVGKFGSLCQFRAIDVQLFVYLITVDDVQIRSFSWWDFDLHSASLPFAYR